VGALGRWGSGPPPGITEVCCYSLPIAVVQGGPFPAGSMRSPTNPLAPPHPTHCPPAEPMINQGSHRDKTWPDGWTSATEDGQRSAQFEHTLVITPTGYDILTARLPTSPPLCVQQQRGASQLCVQLRHWSRWQLVAMSA